MRVGLRISLIFLMCAGMKAHALTPQEECAAGLMSDPRFAWAKWPDIDRKPPNIFPSAMAALLTPHMERLPGGMDPQTHAFYQGIFDFIHDRARVFTGIQEVVAEIDRSGNADREAGLIAIMENYEKLYGLRAVQVRTALSGEEWLALLADGLTFDDLAGSHVHLSLSRELHAPEGQWRHGQLTHRFQLHLVLRDLRAHPERYGNPRDVLALYKKMGDRAYGKSLDWSVTGLLEDGRPTGPLGLFYHLFDSPENNPSSPGFYYQYREYWPTLPLR